MTAKSIHLFTVYVFNYVKVAFVLERKSFNSESALEFILVTYLFFLKTTNVPILSSQIVSPSKELLALAELGDRTKIKLVAKHTRESCVYHQPEIPLINFSSLIDEIFISEPIYFSNITPSSTCLLQVIHSSSDLGILLEQRYISPETLVVSLLNDPSARPDILISYVLIVGCIPSGLIVHIHLVTRMWLGWPYEFVQVPVGVSWTVSLFLEFIFYVLFNSNGKYALTPWSLLNQKLDDGCCISTWSPISGYNTSVSPSALITSIVNPDDFKFFLEALEPSSASIICISPFKLLIQSPHLLLSESLLSKYQLTYLSLKKLEFHKNKKSRLMVIMNWNDIHEWVMKCSSINPNDINLKNKI